MTNALIFDSTGAVGSRVLATLLSSPTSTSLTTVSRRAPLCVENAKAAKAAGVKTYVYCRVQVLAAYSARLL